MNNNEYIILEKVSTHNLKQIDVKLPLNKITAVTGVSGSGKSSLVFDTLYAEAYRRYVESLSSFSRQYLKVLPPPKIKAVYNLPAAISIKQTRFSVNVRSTVGTMTEIIPLIRILFSHLSEVYCDDCNIKVVKYDALKSCKELQSNFLKQKIIIASSLSAFKHITNKALKEYLQMQGLIKLIYNSKIVDIDDVEIKKLKTLDVVVDKLTVNEHNFQRLNEALDLAFKVGKDRVNIFDENLNLIKTFYSTLTCPKCKKQYLEPSESLLSFNHPLGACHECQGFGNVPSINWDKIFVSEHSSLRDKGVKPWNFADHVVLYDLAIKSAKKLKINYHKRFSEYSAQEMNWLKYGDNKGFEGIVGYFKWLEKYKYKVHYRVHLAKYIKYIECPVCKGQRLNKLALSCKLLALNIAQVCSKTVSELSEWVKSISDLVYSNFKDTSHLISQQNIVGCKEPLKELESRINYLIRVGVGYLRIDRPLRTLSGGEVQRINMARCLGNELTDTLYCLDEPTCGLHAKDIDNLIGLLRDLQKQGNTIVIVEHDQNVIKSSDYIIELGPESGHKGGQIVYEGSAALVSQNDTIDNHIKITKTHILDYSKCIMLKGASTHNLQNIDVNFLASSFIAVCGVSGSGKTSLVKYTLYPMLCDFYKQTIEDDINTHTKASSISPASILSQFQQVIFVDQSPLCRSTRSNIATYLGFFDHIRELFASTPMAKNLKLNKSHFSFNTPGGRCDTCKGLGEIEQDLSFLGQVNITCPKCNGKRFKNEVLQVQYKGLNLTEVLSMTVVEARELFFDNKSIIKILDAVIELGLGYLCLGQNTSSFSGGEAQRLKLLKAIISSNLNQKFIFIFDEPSLGLSDKDVNKLIKHLKKLCSMGHTVIVVEHHLGIISCADWIIEIGPNAADQGGNVVYQGPIQDFLFKTDSISAKYVRDYLGIMK